MRLFIVVPLLFCLAAAHEDCKCEKGCGPGYEKSFLDYDGKFKGGARKFVPIYEKQTSFSKDCVVKGGRGEHCGCDRTKRSCDHECRCEKGCGPGYEKSFLDYCGKFKGGARKFAPIYEKQTSFSKDCVVKGGRGHHCGCDRTKRSCDHECRCEKGCGPGFEKSFLDYDGKFKGGARKFVPIYEKQTSFSKDCVVKGGRGEHCGCDRTKRSCDHECRCEKGCGPGYEKSFLDYCGKFKGGARKFVPIYEKQTSFSKDCVVKGGRGHHCGCDRTKRSCDHECRCEKGCGPGYEKSFLDYDGKFKGGARKFAPIYEKQTSFSKDCVVKGGRGHHCGCDRTKRSCDHECRCEKGCGPGFEKSFLDYDGKFKGGARKFVPIYEKQTSFSKDCVVKGGRGHHCPQKE